jgi:hypothetical protein
VAHRLEDFVEDIAVCALRLLGRRGVAGCVLAHADEFGLQVGPEIVKEHVGAGLVEELFGGCVVEGVNELPDPLLRAVGALEGGERPGDIGGPQVEEEGNHPRASHGVGERSGLEEQPWFVDVRTRDTKDAESRVTQVVGDLLPPLGSGLDVGGRGVGVDGLDDEGQPHTPVYAEVNALKEAMVAEQGAGQTIPAAQIARLETLLGITNVGNLAQQPVHTLADIGRLLHMAVAIANNPSTSSLAPIGGLRLTTGNCSGTWCYASAPVQTSEPTSDPQNLHPQYLNGAPNYGFFAYLCGPGSTTETVGSWNSSLVYNFSAAHGAGPQGYMLHIADLEMVKTGSNNSYGQPIYGTQPSTETSTINSQIGTPWYVLVGYPTAYGFGQKIAQDAYSGVPSDMELFTDNLVGWVNTGQYHTVAIFGDDDTNKWLQYYDTATSYASGGSSLGFHTVSQSSIMAGLGVTSLIW